MPKITITRNGDWLTDCRDSADLDEKIVSGEVSLDDQWWEEGVSTEWKSLRDDLPAPAPIPPALPFTNQQTYKPIAGHAYLIPKNCIRCGNDNQKTFKMVHDEGTVDSLSIGFVGDELATSATRRRSILADKFKPPINPERGKVMNFVIGKASAEKIKEYKEAMIVWQNSWCCMNCGYTYVCVSDPTAKGFVRYIELKL